MQKQLTVRIKHVYGIRTVYPVCQDSQILCRIAGTKTLTENIIRAAKDLGYTINVEQEAL